MVAGISMVIARTSLFPSARMVITGIPARSTHHSGFILPLTVTNVFIESDDELAKITRIIPDPSASHRKYYKSNQHANR